MSCVYKDNDLQVDTTETNKADVDSKADEYLLRASDALSGLTITDKTYAGLLNAPLTGRVEGAYLEYGHDIPPITRYGDFHEPDIFTHDAHVRRGLS